MKDAPTYPGELLKNLEGFYLHHYGVNCTVLQTMGSKKDPGSLRSSLHGAFLTALSLIWCKDYNPSGARCSTECQCIFGHIGQVFPAEGHPAKARFKQGVPVPYLLYLPVESSPIYAPGDTLGFRLTLIGHSNRHINALIPVIQMALRLWESNNGQRVALESIHEIGGVKTNYFYRDNIPVYSNPIYPIFPELPARAADTSGDIEIIAGNLLQLRPSGKGRKYLQHPTLGDILQFSLSRLFLLHHFYCGGGYNAQLTIPGEWKDIPLSGDSGIKEETWLRYRGGRKVAEHGITGTLGYRNVPHIHVLTSLLKLAAQAHIGGLTVFGLGKISFTA